MTPEVLRERARAAGFTDPAEVALAFNVTLEEARKAIWPNGIDPAFGTSIDSIPAPSGHGPDPGPEPEKTFQETPSPEYHLTDLGNAERLARDHGHNLRYCRPWRKWLIWDGIRWAEDQTGEVIQLAKETVKRIYAQAGNTTEDSDRKNLAKHALRSEGRDRLSGMVELCQTEPGIPVVPEQLDGNGWLLNVQNGTLDLRDGSFHSHNREWLLTKLAPVHYDPTAVCPQWKAFLEKIFQGNTDLIRFVQKTAGYSLTGDTSEQCFFILYGTGANGKSTFLAALRAMMGDYAQKTPAETLLLKRSGGIPNDVAALRGARFVTASETEDGRKLAESLIKDMTGGEPLTARFLHAEFFSFFPLFKIWLATNHRPAIRGTDEAIWRRIRLIPFDYEIPESERDSHFLDTLTAELPGILNWAIAGCRLWQEEGLKPPQEVKAATEGYREEQDFLGGFLSEYCALGEENRVRAGDLYDLFVDQHGTREMSKTAFGKAMTERGFDRFVNNEKDPETSQWKKVRYYLGLEFKQ